MAIISDVEATSTTRELLWTATNGHAEAPQGIAIQNVDSTDTVYVGGEDVTTSNGYPLAPGEAISLDLIVGDEVWVIASANTPSVRYLITRI